MGNDEPVATSVVNRKIGERDPVTDQLINILLNVPIGGRITFEELSRAVRLDVKTEFRHRLESAKAIILKEGKADFDNDPDVGYIRISPDQIPQHANNKHKKRFKNDTKKYRQRIQCVDPDELNPESRKEYELAIVRVGIRESLMQPEFERAVKSRYGMGMQPEQAIDRAALIEKMKTMG